MIKNKPIYIFAAILIAIVTIAISVVVSVYNKNKPVVPDKYIEVISSNDVQKIKSAYDTEQNKQDFLKLCEEIELAVANKFLNGSVTNEQELGQEITKINNVLKTDDWSYIGVEPSSYWMGIWQLDSKGAVKFAFREENIKPDWAQDEDVNIYIK